MITATEYRKRLEERQRQLEKALQDLENVIVITRSKLVFARSAITEWSERVATSPDIDVLPIDGSTKRLLKAAGIRTVYELAFNLRENAWIKGLGDKRKARLLDIVIEYETQELAL